VIEPALEHALGNSSAPSVSSSTSSLPA
jgi:hypothetical protein